MSEAENIRKGLESILGVPVRQVTVDDGKGNKSVAKRPKGKKK